MNDFKVRSDWMPFCVPDISDAEVQAVSDTVRSGWWAKGPRTIEFEKRFAEYVGAKYCVGVNSCTAALHLALMTQGIGPGDEVITTPLTFASSANTILHVGATPVFADIDPETGLIDPKEIEKKITDKTRAVVPVHYSGLAADIGEIGRLCERYGLFLSEDAAHAVETRYNGELIGHHPKGAVSYSFYATKNLACGEGGALVTDDEEVYKKASILSCHGMSAGSWNRYGKSGSWRYDIEEPGFKYNMFDIQAALALAQLARMDDMQRRRFEAVDVYEQAFRDVPQLRLQKTPDYCHHSRHLYILRIVPEMLTISRDQFIEELKARNVGVSVHFIALHTMSAYTKRYGYKPEDFPKAYAFSESEISLPMYSTLGREKAQYVADAVLDIVKKYKK
ncbi:MAG: DegT/DnrJ/EryC1/StrS family aminotransferase [Clostridiales bacterium]|nr:DegT/DnrJ/EryC1/StrS family aminotransferase [Clostridiales bacterium]MCI6587465.1 DegT/DnrJ/EryC1/StrS family aminotransferase [Clostridiales bacterium]MDY3764691.1 DegT/DnrJ/EryC1/StrS family aminotransferase [Candidatus Ventricola sp.]MDY4541958.1 DegT/DnrJ/EryC1/StrS family aminotransferase [Candidatus Ventricola sp.]MDY4856668.1 DegT/DnrJ/EryC1/StrS family aminotransferase [Candidatus Ventricola sp.]